MNSVLVGRSVVLSLMVGIGMKAAAFSLCAVGDSITQGGSAFVAHRIALESEFAVRGWNAEWKGTRVDTSWGSANPCEGYSGQNAEHIAGQYESHAAAVAADVLLLHAGHNYNADPDTSAPAYMPETEIVAAATNAHARIIAAARSQNPSVIVLYAKVITNSKLPKYSYIPALNTAIGALGAELSTETSPVVVVDMADGWIPAMDCVSDKVHPTATGAAKMAAKWMAAFQGLVNAGKLKVDTVSYEQLAYIATLENNSTFIDTGWTPGQVGCYDRVGKSFKTFYSGNGTARPALSMDVVESCLVEAEAFAERGGWVVDPQFVEQMGSPYLLAHGKGIPVADAKTAVNIKSGRVRAYVRTRDWTPDWNGEKPGRFQLSLGGETFPVTLGVAPATWGWVDAGVVEVGEGPQTLSLHDLTGFEGRCDAIYLCHEGASMPPDDAAALAAWRAEVRGEAGAPDDVVWSDFVVVGGGIAGTASAIAAAEAGLSVAIVQDRPMLGGNASDEIRVLSCKKKDEYHWIVKAIQNGNLDNGYPSAVYDEKRMNLARSYPNLALHLGWRAYGVVTNAERKIVAVDARSVTTGARRRFVAPLFCDATGDGWIAYWSGAAYMLGREAQTEFNEPKAPSVADTSTMGNSVLWTTKTQDVDYVFPEVPWATKVSGTISAISGNWRWEAGLDQDEDTIDDAEMLRDRLFRAIYGAFWTAKQKSENSKRVFDWVAYIAGKRESRRIIGDYVVSEKDVTERRQFEDAIGVATWGIDLHKKKDDSGFMAANDYYRVKPWWMPYRALCCRDVPNLFLAGRCASFTHVAFASCRVQHALGQQGVAVGYAASLCKKYGCLPRGIHEDPAKTAELQALLNLKQSEKGMKEYKWPKSQPVAKGGK